MRTALFLSLTLVTTTVGPAPPRWAVPPKAATDARLRGVSVVSREVVWASGTNGTFARTLDGGKTWKAGRVPDASALDFRDVQAVNAETAYLLAAGPGAASRVYKTSDGGASWVLGMTNPDPEGFFDALAFFDPDHGLLFGDPVDGRFTLLATANGGKTWDRLGAKALPRSLPGEGAFAASGTCLVVQGDRDAWFATGGAKVARVFRSTDRGKSWDAAETPVLAGNPSSGIFSLAFADPAQGVAVGGDYKAPDRPGVNLARTADGGKSWSAVKGAPRDYRSGVASVPGTGGLTYVTVGPTGSDLSLDGGLTWTSLGPTGFHAVSAAGPDAVWAVGDSGRVARLEGLRPQTGP